ncbi:Eco57I restriction-modification methylase domain-containing protein [Vagococcus fluvialis]|uniref:Eco57I restriction-modification methylase domain-containing protein n=1 Tax=Vagococcus fluvialis TaxID=2738 RepID=UPI001D09DC68|nr:Eco57I restriction-modification methylase domain-containing protein [Vagococcus fluvialis]UDM71760.1 Eco57I restriction-modification methylase domain-containing protein [Vagococcus fluvialis]UDM76625.1 Eco57I restriction-modification methylase domain-containing protein [Vagococcus fluvialis]UDM83454.1 Eco57I restriction-modification methylase domain-containing protein [Vagococcus fluvialis]
MKFDVVVGNPPYQESKEGGKDTPIYPFFYDLAEKISSEYCLISPARFLFGAGATNKKWNEKMLTSKHIKSVYFNHKSSDVFPNTDIKGGVAVLYYNKFKDSGPIGIFTTSLELTSILKKVKKDGFKSLSPLIYGVTSYTLSSQAYKDFPQIATRVGKGSGNQLTSGIFDAAPEIFKTGRLDGKAIQVYGRQNNERMYKWCLLKYVNLPENFDRYKVFVPAASGTGVFGEALSNPIVGYPNIGHTATFISIGSFSTESQAENLLKYLKSKFFRAMLSIKKTTQHNKTREVFSTVPIQNFNENSDIDWTKSVSEIDNQLYRKYNLAENEILYVENNIKTIE